MKQKLFLIKAVLALLGFGGGEIFACTGVRLIAKDGSIVHGRTLEFGVVVETSLAVVPRGMPFTGHTPLGNGLAYRSKYACVGTIAFDQMAILDGMNEKGLCVGTFFFPGYAVYSEVTKEDRLQGLSPTEFPHWILTQFASVEELIDSLDSIVIAPTVSKGWGDAAPPFHYIVYDKSGRCLVIEPMEGVLVAYDNPLGILTNSPTFDWHMTNLQNFINLSPVNAAPLKAEGITFAPFGQGSGMVGLPGDFTPPSRFVRAFFFCQSAFPSQNGEEAVFQAFHILNPFDIPLGFARSTSRGEAQADFTQMTCVRNPQSLKYYFKTYENQSIRSVDLSRFDWNAKTIKKISTAGIEKAVDISEGLK